MNVQTLADYLSFSDADNEDPMWNSLDLNSPDVKEKKTRSLKDTLLDISYEELSEPIRNNTWVFTAIGAGISFALSNFLLSKTSHYGLYSKLQTTIGNLVFSLAFTFFYLNRSHQGLSTFSRKFLVKSWAILAIDWFITFVGGLMTIFTFKYALYAGVNQGIITSLFALSSVYLAIAAYVLFNEKVTKAQIVGMFFMILWAIMLLVPKDSGDRKTITVFDEEVEMVSPYVPVGWAVITSLAFWLRTILLKVYTVKMSYDPMMFTSVSYVLSGSVFSLVCVVVMCQTGWTFDVLVINIVSGILSCLGNVLINHATSTGFAGPASGLTNVQPIIQTVLNAFLLSQFPSHSQLLGLILGIAGSVALTVPFKI